MKEINDVFIIGIDSGYGNIKTANCCFPASVAVYDTEPVFKDNLLVYDGRYYLIGEGHKEFLADKTKDIDYYVLALAGIARELNIRKITSGKVHIAAGLPLTWVSGQRNEFKDYLMKCSCGCKFNQRGWNHHNGADEMAFQCYSKLAHGSVTERKKRGLPTKDTCTTPIIPKWKMELIAHEIFTKHFTDISAVTELACKMIEEHINDVEDVEDNTEIIAQKNAEIEKLERKKVGLIEMRADGDIERDYFLMRKDEVEKQIEHLQQEIQELTPIDTRQKKEDLVERLEALKQKLSEYTDFENTLIIPDGVIEAFTEQIIASDKGFDWYLKAVPDMVKSFMDDTPDDETEKEWHELTQFDLTIEDAKAYVYSFSSRRRVHGWQNIKIRLFV